MFLFSFFINSKHFLELMLFVEVTLFPDKIPLVSKHNLFIVVLIKY